MRLTLRHLPAKAARKLTGLLPNAKFRPYALQWIHLNLENCEPELKHLRKLLPPPSQRRIAIDIGANCGYYSIEMQKYFGTVYSFEINPDLAARLAILGQNVSVISAGLSLASPGEV